MIILIAMESLAKALCWCIGDPLWSCYKRDYHTARVGNEPFFLYLYLSSSDASAQFGIKVHPEARASLLVMFWGPVGDVTVLQHACRTENLNNTPVTRIHAHLSEFPVRIRMQHFHILPCLFLDQFQSFMTQFVSSPPSIIYGGCYSCGGNSSCTALKLNVTPKKNDITGIGDIVRRNEGAYISRSSVIEHSTLCPASFCDINI